MQELDLNCTKVKDVTALGNLSKTLVSDALRKCNNLQRLELMNTRVADVIPLGNRTSLQMLDLSYTHVRDLSALGKCSS